MYLSFQKNEVIVVAAVADVCVKDSLGSDRGRDNGSSNPSASGDCL